MGYKQQKPLPSSQSPILGSLLQRSLGPPIDSSLQTRRPHQAHTHVHIGLAPICPSTYTHNSSQTTTERPDISSPLHKLCVRKYTQLDSTCPTVQLSCKHIGIYHFHTHLPKCAHKHAHVDTWPCWPPPQTHMYTHTHTIVIGYMLRFVCVCAHTHTHTTIHVCTETHHGQACVMWLIANTWASGGCGLSQPFEASGLVAPLPVSTVRK